MALTEEQQAVVGAPIDARIIVRAQAGSGKTTVLIERLRELIRRGAHAGSEMLVLTFARSVARKIRRQLRNAGDAGFVRVQTFDSFATRVLAQASNGDSWSDLGYEARIRLATQHIKNGRGRDILTAIRHIFVDELQDLMEDRAAFVGAILEYAEAGATVFTDPAQSIYEFQVGDRPNGIGPDQLLDVLEKSLSRKFQTRLLTRNFRAQGELPRRALDFGDDLALRPQPRALADTLLDFYLDLPPQTLRTVIGAMHEAGGSSAILCRTNGEALWIARELAGSGVAHVYQRRADDRAVARWIGVAFALCPNTVVSRARFDSLVPDGALPADLSRDEAWRLLRRVDRSSGDAIDLLKLAARLQTGDVPDDLNETNEAADVVVSTVHRAKGLEFDNVALVGLKPPGPESGGLEEELRVLYVALTRPRCHLWRVEEPIKGLWQTRQGRWCASERGRRVSQVEVFGNDVDQLDPACAGEIECDARHAQEHIRDQLTPGDDVILELHRRSVDGRPLPLYKIVHRGLVVGMTSRDFGASLSSLLNARPAPEWITELRVEMADTVAGTTAAAERARLGAGGIWLRARAQGLGRLVWEAAR